MGGVPHCDANPVHQQGQPPQGGRAAVRQPHPHQRPPVHRLCPGVEVSDPCDGKRGDHALALHRLGAPPRRHLRRQAGQGGCGRHQDLHQVPEER